ncbi:MAG: pyridoxamine 5'-phosphate oxidase family protein [Acidimicrobiia bacterium]
MGRTHAQIDDSIAEWISAQPMFFVGTAPLAGDGHVNVSPKGLAGTFAILGPLEVAYLDLTGSGVETIAHLRENGRITLMWCAFDGPPRIVRVQGTGRAVMPDDAGFDALLAQFPDTEHLRVGVRSIVVVDVDRVGDSCGYAVPLMEMQGHRDQLVKWADRKGRDGVEEYWTQKNVTSVDGLPGVL